jgi:hypothetical protein
MKISWVLSDSVVLDPTQDTTKLKNIGSFWGSWRTWRSCQTDNVICNDLDKGVELIKREFQKQCNMYIPNSVYQSLQRPSGVQLYEGEFKHDVDHQDEIIAMHLAASTSDIILLLGFDLTKKTPDPDKLQEHRNRNYYGLIRQAIIDNNQVQWVLIDHPNPVNPKLFTLENLTIDTLDNVVNMFSA